MPNLNRLRRGRRRGAQMVEFAIILPVLVFLLFGIIQYGWIFLKVSQLNQAARMGTRVAVRPAATEDEVRDAIDEVMSSARLASSGYTISISDLGVDVGEPVEIQVDVNYANNDNIELLGISLLPRPDALHGRAVMAKEGP
jgi:Flp pilus assembly protein TadG